MHYLAVVGHAISYFVGVQIGIVEGVSQARRKVGIPPKGLIDIFEVAHHLVGQSGHQGSVSIAIATMKMPAYVPPIGQLGRVLQ